MAAYAGGVVKVVTLREIAERSRKSRQAIRERRFKEGWPSAGSMTINGGEAEGFHLYNLPDDIQALFSNRLHKVASLVKPPLAEESEGFDCGPSVDSPPFGQGRFPSAPALVENKPLSEEEIELDIFSRAPEYARRKAKKYLGIITASRGMTGATLRAFIERWNQRHPDARTSYARVMAARRTYEKEGIAGLLAGYGKAAGKTAVRDKEFEHFKSAYLKEGAPSLKSCWIKTLGFAGVPVSEFPSPKSFLRRLEKEMPKQAIYLARHGRQKWNVKYGRYLDRDYSGLKPGECIVSDHAQLDVAVMLPSGKPCFPWITAWRDFKSGKWLGWHLHPEPPNSDHVFQAFYYAVKAHGLPTDVYVDNGKDYRVRDFAGGRSYHKISVDEGRATAMLSLLEITPHFSIPYNPQSKTIERDFLKSKEWFSKHMPGYRGGQVKERPEALKAEIKQGRILPWNELETLMDGFIKDVLNKMPSDGSKVLQGRCPDELWEAERVEMKRPRSRQALSLFCMRASKPLTVGRNGVKDAEMGVTYWAEEMSGIKGQKVYLRRDPRDFGEAWVFSLQDEFLCMAHIAERPAALARTPVEKGQLKALMAEKRQHEKITKAYTAIADRPSPAEALAHMKAGVEALNKGRGYKSGKEEVNIIRVGNTRMDQAVRKRKEMEEEGRFDVKRIMPREPAKKPKIYLNESDKLAAEGGGGKCRK